MSSRRIPFVSALLVLLALAGCTTEQPPEPTPQPVRVKADQTETPRTLTFAVAGDSLTGGNSNYSFPTPGPDFETNTWTYWALQDGAQLTGGFAYPGMQSAGILANVVPVQSDVFVIMVGTNNVLHATGTQFITQALADIAAMPAETEDDAAVVLCAIPPSDSQPVLAETYNEALERLASAKGWEWVDPWQTFRVGGEWRAGFSGDGIHANAESATVAGGEIVAAMRRAFVTQSLFRR